MELKFRGVDLKTGKMVYGGGIDTDRDTPVIISQGDRYFVDEKTIGQYTGLKDRYCSDIYNGDVIELWGSKLEVKWIFDGWFAECYSPEFCQSGQGWEGECEVIGNIHENPKLLGE